ncbi:MAG: helix-turn-helix transcriptional regulator [Acaryochloris sp. RU_4_1]|nr:helix-turn-helix transcriptional regulator [Acaryochloris sp. RU_4_1]NJR56951.1 helix-turn-helix transcriptional regulator [Acaryochloris sp. CRU_2_0]
MAEKHSIRCRLQEWIEESGGNYSTVAEAVGVDVGAIRRLAKNQFDRVDCVTWQAICDYFKKPIGELFFQEDVDVA